MKRFLRLMFYLSLICLISVSARPFSNLDQLHHYVQKKIKRNEKVLQIRSRTIGDAGVQFLAKSPLLQNLHTLVLYETGISDQGVRALSQSAFLKNLKTLDLGHNQIGNQGAQFLAESTSFSSLENFHLQRDLQVNQW